MLVEKIMSLDRSLKTAAGLSRHRNVLSRTERVAKLVESKKFDMTTGNPMGLPKVANRKVVAAAKPKKEAAEGEAAAGTAATPAKPAAAAASAKPAAAAPAGKPAAKGGKGK